MQCWQLGRRISSHLGSWERSLQLSFFPVTWKVLEKHQMSGIQAELAYFSLAGAGLWLRPWQRPAT